MMSRISTIWNSGPQFQRLLFFCPKDWPRLELFNWSNLLFQIGIRKAKVFGLNASHTLYEVGQIRDDLVAGVLASHVIDHFAHDLPPEQHADVQRVFLEPNGRPLSLGNLQIQAGDADVGGSIPDGVGFSAGHCMEQSITMNM